MCSASSTSGCIHTGNPPRMIRPPIALLCELRGIAIFSPGLSAVIIMHWLPLVEPLIRKYDCSAPKHSAASSCASTSASSGCSRSSRPRICVRSIASTLSPTKSRNARSIPMPLFVARRMKRDDARIDVVEQHLKIRRACMVESRETGSPRHHNAGDYIRPAFGPGVRAKGRNARRCFPPAPSSPRAARLARRSSPRCRARRCSHVSAQVAVPTSARADHAADARDPGARALLGRELGPLAVLAYLAEGALGLPVLPGLRRRPIELARADRGAICWDFRSPPTFGHAARAWSQTRLRAALRGDLRSARRRLRLRRDCWLIGLHLSVASPRSRLGIVPFLIGDLAKCPIAAAVRAARARSGSTASKPHVEPVAAARGDLAQPRIAVVDRAYARSIAS